MDRVGTDVWKSIREQMHVWDSTVDDYIDRITSKQRTKLLHFFDPLTESVKNVANAIDTFLIGKVKELGDQWNNFLKSIGLKPATPESGAWPNRRIPGMGGTRDQPWTSNPLLASALGAPKVTHYGYPWDPYMDPMTRLGLGAYGNQLEIGDIALNKAGAASIGLDYYKDLGKIFQYHGRLFRYADRAADVYHGRALGPRFDIYDPRGIVPESGPIDWSSVGRPLRVRGLDLAKRPSVGGHPEQFRTPSQTEWERQQGITPITINYGPIHCHGTDGLEHRLAETHRRHIEQMKKDLAEAVYQRNRQDFAAGAHAV
jgi:hypothetical protein